MPYHTIQYHTNNELYLTRDTLTTIHVIGILPGTPLEGSKAFFFLFKFPSKLS